MPARYKSRIINSGNLSNSGAAPNIPFTRQPDTFGRGLALGEQPDHHRLFRPLRAKRLILTA